MKICVPSYNRLNGVQEKTIQLLNKYECGSCYIFVSTQKDYDEYTAANIGNVVLVPAEFAKRSTWGRSRCKRFF